MTGYVTPWTGGRIACLHCHVFERLRAFDDTRLIAELVAPDSVNIMCKTILRTMANC